MAEHGELFESKILVLVEPLTCMTRLCPLQNYKNYTNYMNYKNHRTTELQNYRNYRTTELQNYRNYKNYRTTLRTTELH